MAIEIQGRYDPPHSSTRGKLVSLNEKTYLKRANYVKAWDAKLRAYVAVFLR